MATSFTKMVENAKKDKGAQIIDVNPEELMDDPDNREIYNEYDVKLLAEDMKKNGVIGTIVAYPENGKYRIESGHRRKYAAIQAGVKKIPVQVTTPPQNDIERRKRLLRANMHFRNYSTMTIAREAQYMYETYEKEKELMEAQGLKPEESPGEQVAANLEISPAQVSRYRALLKLSPELQSLVDMDKMPWNAFCDATSLNQFQQHALFLKVSGAVKSFGIDTVTSSYVRKQIEECSLLSSSEYQFDRNSLSSYEEAAPGKEKKARRINGATTLKKGAKSIRDSLDAEKAFIKPGQRNAILEELRSLSAFINEKIQEFDAEGFSDDFNRKVK